MSTWHRHRWSSPAKADALGASLAGSVISESKQSTDTGRWISILFLG